MRVSCNVFFTEKQFGQAMSEALIVIAILFIVLTSIQLTGSMQLSTLQMLVSSTKNVFEISLGQSVGKDIKIISPDLQRTALITPLVHKLNAELFMTDPGFVSASSSSGDPRVRHANILRHSYIESGNGYAASDGDVQKRIERSRSIWSDTYQISSASIRSVEALSSKTDSAWNRPRVSLDFIHPWKGVIPRQTPIDIQGQPPRFVEVLAP
ncbi:MAG: hypothetical protein Q7J51_09885 [Sheuella sp.]|nr:hypothetical protein [Sheuella sp.]